MITCMHPPFLSLSNSLTISLSQVHICWSAASSFSFNVHLAEIDKILKVWISLSIYVQINMCKGINVLWLKTWFQCRAFLFYWMSWCIVSLMHCSWIVSHPVLSIFTIVQLSFSWIISTLVSKVVKVCSHSAAPTGGATMDTQNRYKVACAQSTRKWYEMAHLGPNSGAVATAHTTQDNMYPKKQATYTKLHVVTNTCTYRAQ